MALRVSTTPVELLIDASVVAALDQEMRSTAPRRAAGFLLGHSSGVILSARALCSVRTGTNGGGGQFSSVLTSSDYRRALRKARGLGLKVVASYSTRPDGDPHVSLREIASFRRSPLASLVVTARPNGAAPRLEAYGPPTGGAITVAVGRGADRDPA